MRGCFDQRRADSYFSGLRSGRGWSKTPKMYAPAIPVPAKRVTCVAWETDVSGYRPLEVPSKGFPPQLLVPLTPIGYPRSHAGAQKSGDTAGEVFEL